MPGIGISASKSIRKSSNVNKIPDGAIQFEGTSEYITFEGDEENKYITFEITE